jgi:hypothetical protein
MLKQTGRTVWVAVSRYSLEDDVEPIVVVGTSKEAAEAALDIAVRSHNEDMDGQELRELWIDEAAIELPVFAI